MFTTHLFGLVLVDSTHAYVENYECGDDTSRDVVLCSEA
jgi:hypothetical protein